MSESSYFSLVSFRSKQIAEVTMEYLKTFHLVKDSKARIFTKEECNFLGMNTAYQGDYILVAPIWYQQFKNTTLEVSQAARDFEAGWDASEKIHRERQELLDLEFERKKLAKAKKNAICAGDYVRCISKYDNDHNTVWFVHYTNDDEICISNANMSTTTKLVLVNEYKKVSTKETKLFSLKK